MLRIDPQCTVGAHLCLLKIFWTFAQRWFYIFYLSICIFLFYISYIFVSFHHWSELIFASWSSFWSSSQLLHSTDGIALSTQWHVSIIYNLCFFLLKYMLSSSCYGVLHISSRSHAFLWQKFETSKCVGGKMTNIRYAEDVICKMWDICLVL